MAKQQENAENVQGTELYTEKELAQANEPKKERKVSASYTIRAFAGNIKKLNEMEMLEEQDKKDLQRIAKKVQDRFLSLDLFGD